MNAELVGHCRGEADVSVLRTNTRLTDPSIAISTSSTIHLGQEVYFLGFPYKMWGDVGHLMDGLPCPFAKRGIVSSFGVDNPLSIHLDAINNEGFSGGPLVARHTSNPKQMDVVGIVSKFRVEREPVIDKQGNDTGSYIEYNTGFMIAYNIKSALNLIASKTID